MLLVLTLTLSFSQIVLAAEQKVEDKKQTAEITGDEEIYVVSNVATTEEVSGATKKPVVEFSLMSSAFLAHKVNRGSYCNLFTVGGFWTKKAATAARDALAHAAKVLIDPKDFETDWDQESHNDSVPEVQEEQLASARGTPYGSAEYSACYTYDIDVSKIIIINDKGEKLTLKEEIAKNKNYGDGMSDQVAINLLKLNIEKAQKKADRAREILDLTVGTVPREKAKQRLQEEEAKVSDIVERLKLREGVAKETSKQAAPATRSNGIN